MRLVPVYNRIAADIYAAIIFDVMIMPSLNFSNAYDRCHVTYVMRMRTPHTTPSERATGDIATKYVSMHTYLESA